MTSLTTGFERRHGPHLYFGNRHHHKEEAKNEYMRNTKRANYKSVSTVVHMDGTGCSARNNFSPTYQGAVKKTKTGRGVSLPRTLFVNCSAVSINLPPDLVICRALLIRETLPCGPMKAFVVDNIIPKRKKNREIGDLVDFIL